jgi:hypothetical protein
MRNRAISAIGAGAAVLLGLALAVHGQGKDSQTLTSFRVPEFDDAGKMKSQIFGDYAEVMPNGVIKITKLTMEFYKGDEVEMRVTAPKCIYDKDRGGAASESDVKIERENMEVTGTGFLWDGKKERLQIFTNTQVVLKEVRKHINAGDKK